MTALASQPASPVEATTEAAALPAAGSSFYTAMRLLPAEQRDAMYAVYAFCRAVDDVADDGGAREVRAAELDRCAPTSTRSMRPAGPCRGRKPSSGRCGSSG